MLWRFLSITAIASAQDDVFIATGFKSATISMLSLLKHIYGGGFMSRRSRMSQKTIPIAAVPKNTVIDPMYSSSPKKGRNTRYIAAFFAPATVVQFFVVQGEIIWLKNSYTNGLRNINEGDVIMKYL